MDIKQVNSITDLRDNIQNKPEDIITKALESVNLYHRIYPSTDLTIFVNSDEVIIGDSCEYQDAYLNVENAINLSDKVPQIDPEYESMRLDVSNYDIYRPTYEPTESSCIIGVDPQTGDQEYTFISDPGDHIQNNSRTIVRGAVYCYYVLIPDGDVDTAIEEIKYEDTIPALEEQLTCDRSYYPQTVPEDFDLQTFNSIRLPAVETANTISEYYEQEGFDIENYLFSIYGDQTKVLLDTYEESTICIIGKGEATKHFTQEIIDPHILLFGDEGHIYIRLENILEYIEDSSSLKVDLREIIYDKYDPETSKYSSSEYAISTMISEERSEYLNVMQFGGEIGTTVARTNTYDIENIKNISNTFTTEVYNGAQKRIFVADSTQYYIRKELLIALTLYSEVQDLPQVTKATEWRPTFGSYSSYTQKLFKKYVHRPYYIAKNRYETKKRQNIMSELRESYQSDLGYTQNELTVGDIECTAYELDLDRSLLTTAADHDDEIRYIDLDLKLFRPHKLTFNKSAQTRINIENIDNIMYEHSSLATKEEYEKEILDNAFYKFNSSIIQDGNDARFIKTISVIIGNDDLDTIQSLFMPELTIAYERQDNSIMLLNMVANYMFRKNSLSQTPS